MDFEPVRAKAKGREAYLPEEVWELFPEDSLNQKRKPMEWALCRLEDYLERAKAIPSQQKAEARTHPCLSTALEEL